MAIALSTQLENLGRERERLDELLMLDSNWRALRQLETREAAGEPLQAVAGAGLKQGLLRSLASNRIYAARNKLLETIALLSSDTLPGAPEPEGNSLANRIVLLGEPSGENFRTRLRMKAAEAAALSAVIPAGPTGRSLQPKTAHVKSDPAPVLSAATLPTVHAPVAPTHICPAPPDALELIDGLGRRAVEHLQDAGVTRFSDIAAWSSADVGVWHARLDGDAHGSAGWWIEQAAILSIGRATQFARRARRGEFAALVPAPAPEPPRPKQPVALSVPAPAVASAPSTDEVAAVAVGAPTGVPTCAPTGVPTLAALVDIEAAVRKGGPPLQATADDLVDALSADAPAGKPAETIVVVVHSAEVTAAPPTPTPKSQGALPLASPSRAGYVRPGHRAPEAGDAEPVIRAGDAEAKAHEPGARGVSRPRTLLRRLKDLNDPARFEADGYAAYRGTVEEASVTILDAADARPEGKAAPRIDPAAATEPASRFLKALTGNKG